MRPIRSQCFEKLTRRWWMQPYGERTISKRLCHTSPDSVEIKLLIFTLVAHTCAANLIIHCIMLFSVLCRLNYSFAIMGLCALGFYNNLHIAGSYDTKQSFLNFYVILFFLILDKLHFYPMTARKNFQF